MDWFLYILATIVVLFAIVYEVVVFYLNKELSDSCNRCEQPASDNQIQITIVRK